MPWKRAPLTHLSIAGATTWFRARRYRLRSKTQLASADEGAQLRCCSVSLIQPIGRDAAQDGCDCERRASRLADERE